MVTLELARVHAEQLQREAARTRHELSGERTGLRRRMARRRGSH